MKRLVVAQTPRLEDTSTARAARWSGLRGDVTEARAFLAGRASMAPGDGLPDAPPA